MYRFLLSARWLGLAGLALTLAALMVVAGRWQLDRYHEKSAVNARIEAAATAQPVPVRDALPAPGGTAGTAGRPAPAAAEFSRVGVTGRYDVAHEILVRGRTVDGQVGFEVLTPLVLDGGVAVLVDRGWVAAPTGDATARPDVPAPPSGEVTVAGRVAQPESRAGSPDRVGDGLQVRRIAAGAIAPELPYPLFGSHVLLDAGQPGADGLVAVPSPRQRAWQNGGYAAQWWIFAALTVGAFCWLARREAHGPPPERGADRLQDRAADVPATAR